jgi:hypothetical protein
MFECPPEQGFCQAVCSSRGPVRRSLLTVHDSSDVPAGPTSFDAVRLVFDEERLLSDAGLLLCATLADRLGLSELVDESVS